jgi:hypothetical protein
VPTIARRMYAGCVTSPGAPVLGFFVCVVDGLYVFPIDAFWRDWRGDPVDKLALPNMLG